AGSCRWDSCMRLASSRRRASSPIGHFSMAFIRVTASSTVVNGTPPSLAWSSSNPSRKRFRKYCRRASSLSKVIPRHSTGLCNSTRFSRLSRLWFSLFCTIGLLLFQYDSHFGRLIPFGDLIKVFLKAFLQLGRRRGRAASHQSRAQIVDLYRDRNQAGKQFIDGLNEVITQLIGQSPFLKQNVHYFPLLGSEQVKVAAGR